MKDTTAVRPLKAISLWQPYASAMAMASKRFETRSKAIKYRGNLAICSALKRLKPDDLPIDVHRWMRENLEGGNDLKKLLADLPYGKVLCVVELYDCRDAFEVWQAGLPLNEEMLGGYHDQGYSCGRFAWMTRNLRVLKEPVPVTGRQFLFDLPPDVEAKVRAQL